MNTSTFFFWLNMNTSTFINLYDRIFIIWTNAIQVYEVLTFFMDLLVVVRFG